MIYYRLNTINCQNILFFIKLNLFIKITENFKKIRFTGDLQTFLSAMSSSKEPHCEGEEEIEMNWFFQAVANVDRNSIPTL
jgi:hypothetical protein